MRITAQSVYDQKTIQAMTWFMMFRKNEPKKRMAMWMAIYAALVGVMILEMILWGYSSWMMILIVASVVIMLLELYLFFLLPKLRYKKTGKLADIRNEYIFSDTQMEVTSAGKEYAGTATVQYELLNRIYETGAYLFLFLDGNRCYIVDKSTLQGGTAEDLCAALSRVIGKRYIRCNY